MISTLSGEHWLIDLDGVVWLSDAPIPGSSEAIRALQAAGVHVAFFTNNSFSTREEMHAKFSRHGIELSDDDLLSSSQSAAQLVEPGARVTVLGGAGIHEALAQRGVEVVDLDTVDDHVRLDAVVVGMDRQLTFDRLTRACRAISRGARFIATNDDATYPTSDGELPGGGALVAAVSYATRVKPTIAGKPHLAAAELVHSRFASISLVVGDRPETDGELAGLLRAPFALVRSGVTPVGVPVDPAPEFDFRDLSQLVDGALNFARKPTFSDEDVHL